MKKKQMYQMLAGAVGICFIVCLVSTVKALLEVSKAGGTLPFAMIVTTVMTGFCTVVIWKSVRRSEE